jgi:hypothetical protein
MSPWIIQIKASDKPDGTGNPVTKTFRILDVETNYDTVNEAQERLDGYEDPPNQFRRKIDIIFWVFLVNPDVRFLADRSNPARPQDGGDLEELLAMMKKRYTWITDVTLPRYDTAGQGYYNTMFAQPMLFAYREYSKNKGSGIIDFTLTVAKRSIES